MAISASVTAFKGTLTMSLQPKIKKCQASGGSDAVMYCRFTNLKENHSSVHNALYILLQKKKKHSNFT